MKHNVLDAPGSWHPFYPLRANVTDACVLKSAHMVGKYYPFCSNRNYSKKWFWNLKFFLETAHLKNSSRTVDGPVFKGKRLSFNQHMDPWLFVPGGMSWILMVNCNRYLLLSIRTVRVANDWYPQLLCSLLLWLLKQVMVSSDLKVQARYHDSSVRLLGQLPGFCFWKTEVTTVTVFALCGIMALTYSRRLWLHSECSKVKRNAAGSRTNANDPEAFFIFNYRKGSQCSSHSSRFLKKQTNSICSKWRKSSLGQGNHSSGVWGPVSQRVPRGNFAACSLDDGRDVLHISE